MASIKQVYKVALLSAKVLGKRKFTSTITASYLETVTGSDKSSKDRVIIEVEDGETRIALNKNNANNLAKVFGDDYEEWIGKKVLVGIKPEEYMGKKCDGLDIQPVKK
jgi:hypothetical protein